MRLNVMANAINRVSNAIYLVIALALVLTVLFMVGTSIWELASIIFSGKPYVPTLTRAISLAVISLAVFDVAKFIVEEELIRHSEMRSTVQARQSLTKFITIIIVAVSLEALVLIFDLSKSDQRLSDLIYPTLMLGSVVLLLIGLGFFQYISRRAMGRNSPSTIITERAHLHAKDESLD